MGKPTAVDAAFYDPVTSKCALFCKGKVINPKHAYVEQSYERKKGPKVLNRIKPNPQKIFANPNAIIQQSNEIIAIDTNTKVINSRSVSLCGVVGGQNTKVVVSNCTTVRYKPLKCFEYHNIKCKPENVAWREVIKLIQKAPNYSNRKKIALIVDSDLGDINSYNMQALPIIGDFYLPENFHLIYASADNGGENIANKMIKLADKIASDVLKNIEHNFTNKHLIEIKNKEYSHYRDWEFKA